MIVKNIHVMYYMKGNNEIIGAESWGENNDNKRFFREGEFITHKLNNITSKRIISRRKTLQEYLILTGKI